MTQANVTFIQAPVRGARAHMILNGQEAWSSIVQTVTFPGSGMCRAVTVSGDVYLGAIQDRPSVTPATAPSRPDQWAWFRRLALWKRIVLVYLLVSLVVTFFALLSSDEDQRYAQSRYPYLAQRIPGLRYFPGWAQSDEAPWYFQEYQVDKVGFHVGFSTNSVKVDVVRAGTTDTQVSLFVYLYDVNGNLIDWCQPVKPHMYFPGGRFSRKEKFQRVGGPQPVFYCLYQPPTATPRPVPVRPSPAVTSPVPVASPPTAEPTHDPVMACIKAQRFVRARLKAPRTAKFPWPSAEYVDDLGSQRYRVISYVDAQNSFGAMLRSNYICELQYVGNGQWEEISCEILEP